MWQCCCFCDISSMWCIITRLKGVSSISSLVFSFLIYGSLEMLIPTYWQIANINQYIGWVLLKGTTAFYCTYSPDYVGIILAFFFRLFKIACLEICCLIYFSVFIYLFICFYKSALRQCLKCTTNTQVFRAVFACTKPNAVWWLMFLADTGNLCVRLIGGSSFWQSAAHNFTTSNSGSALHLLWTQTLKSTEDNKLLHPFHHFVYLCLNHPLLPFTLHELLFLCLLFTVSPFLLTSMSFQPPHLTSALPFIIHRDPLTTPLNPFPIQYPPLLETGWLLYPLSNLHIGVTVPSQRVKEEEK